MPFIFVELLATFVVFNDTHDQHNYTQSTHDASYVFVMETYNIG